MPDSWFKIENKGAAAVIDVFNEIGSGGVSANEFVEQFLAAGPFPKITLNIDSPGGDVLDGFRIYDAINASDAYVIVNVVGNAASMASVIMLAGDEINIAENGGVMIHRVTSGAKGNADDIEAASKVTRELENRIVSVYVSKTKQTEAQIREWMKSPVGTWFFGQAAVDAGFAHSVIKGSKAKAFKPEWAGMFTMLPSMLFDTSRNTTLENITSPVMTEQELIAAQEKLAADQAKLAADQKALTDLAAEQAANVVKPEAIKKEDVAAAVAEALKPLNAELETLKAAVNSGVAAAAGGRSAVDLANKGEGASDKTMARAAWEALGTKDRADFIANGGKLTD